MYLQEIALPPGSEQNKKRKENYSSRSSLKSSQNENRQGLSDENMSHTEDISGEF